MICSPNNRPKRSVEASPKTTGQVPSNAGLAARYGMTGAASVERVNWRICRIGAAVAAFFIM